MFIWTKRVLPPTWSSSSVTTRGTLLLWLCLIVQVSLSTPSRAPPTTTTLLPNSAGQRLIKVWLGALVGLLPPLNLTWPRFIPFCHPTTVNIPLDTWRQLYMPSTTFTLLMIMKSTLRPPPRIRFTPLCTFWILPILKLILMPSRRLHRIHLLSHLIAMYAGDLSWGRRFMMVLYSLFSNAVAWVGALFLPKGGPLLGLQSNRIVPPLVRARLKYLQQMRSLNC